MYLKDEFLKTVISVYDRVCEIQTDEGQFVDPESGYTIYSQYAGYYFALLYTLDNENNPYYKKDEALERAIKGWDFYSTQITDNGLAKIITFNQFWYDSIDEWGIYYWINTIELIKDYIDSERLDKWNSCIDKAVERIKEHIYKVTQSEKYQIALGKNDVHNHFIWTLLCFYRYGMIRNIVSIIDDARKELERLIMYQSDAGTWKESGTLVVNYAEVTACAISLFELFDNNLKAENAIRKNLNYVLSTIYPDLTKNECIDGRNRHSKSIVSYTALTFYKYGAGICYLSNWIRYISKNVDIGRKLQGLAVITDITNFMPEDIKLAVKKEDIKSAVEKEDIKSVAKKEDIKSAAEKIELKNTESISDNSEKSSDAGIWDYVPETTYYDGYKAKIVRRDNWVITMCCLEQEVFNNRFILERQNLLSIYNNKSGLLIGGGHSISQPELSCFNIISCGKLYYLHKEGRINEDILSMSLIYGERKCNVEAMLSDKIKITYTVEGLAETERAFVNIPIPGLQGLTIELDNETVTWDTDYHIKNITSGKRIKCKNMEISLTEDAIFQYPVFPYNSYKQVQKKDYSEAFGIIRVELNYIKSKCDLLIRET